MKKECHILAWMVVLHMHIGTCRVTQHGVYHPCSPKRSCHQFSTFIYHLSHDCLGSVLVMKALAQRGHSPRLIQVRGGFYALSDVIHKHCGLMLENAMYGYMNKHLNLVSDAPNIGPELAGDVIEIAYNLYFMYAALNIDVASLLGIDPSCPYRMVGTSDNDPKRCIHPICCNLLGGKGAATSRFEQVCIYISGLTQLTAKEAISVTKKQGIPYWYLPSSFLSFVWNLCRPEG